MGADQASHAGSLFRVRSAQLQLKRPAGQCLDHCTSLPSSSDVAQAQVPGGLRGSRERGAVGDSDLIP